MMEWSIDVADLPLFGPAATVASYAAATGVWSRFGRPAILHPVLLATIAVAALLHTTGASYESYSAQTVMFNQGLSVIVVLLAVPLFRQLSAIRQAGIPILTSLAVGSMVAIVTALALPVVTGSDDTLLATLAAKSATTAVSVQIAEKFGGVGGLTAVVVISTGVFGAVAGPTILRLHGVHDHRAQGLALGVASHAIGTARGFAMSDTAGAFAGLGMILNALLTIILVPPALAVIASG